MAANPLPRTSIRLVICDVDGTLVTRQKVLTEDARQAVDRVRNAGIFFTITSSRPARGLKMLIDDLHLTEPVGALNGGLIVHPDLSPVHKRTLPAEAARRIVDGIAAHGLDVWVCTDQDWFVRDPGGPYVAHEQHTVKFSPAIVDGFDGLLNCAIKIVGVSEDYDAVARCEAELQQAGEGVYSATRSQRYYLDVTHAEANKGQVLLTLSRMLGIPPGEIATIGDMSNDVLMFRHAGLSIAMGNAAPEVQKAAHCVTTSNEEEGFANAMERFVLANA